MGQGCACSSTPFILPSGAAAGTFPLSYDAGTYLVPILVPQHATQRTLKLCVHIYRDRDAANRFAYCATK